MKLFRIINNFPYISEEALTINEFSIIWKKDKSKDKSKAIQELGYIFFLTDYTSAYQVYSEDIRNGKVAKDTIGIENYKPDKDVINGIRNMMSYNKPEV